MVNMVNHPRYDVVFVLDKLLEELFTFSLPQPLQDDLFGGLSGDSAGVVGQWFGGRQFVSDGNRLLDRLSFLQANLSLRVLYVINHRPQCIDVDLSGVGVELDRDVLARC